MNDSEPVGLVRDSARVAVGTGLSRLSGLLRVGVFAWALGQSQLADTYNLANVVPNLLYELVLGGVLSATLVPMFVQAERERDAGGDDTASVLLSVGLVAVAVLTLAGLGGVALIDAIGGNGRVGTDAVRWDSLMILCALVLPQVLFYGVTTLASAALNARHVFGPPAVTPVLTNLVTSAALVMVGLRLGERDERLDLQRLDTTTLGWLGIGTTLGVAAMALPLLVVMRRRLDPFDWRPELGHPAVKRLIRLSGWTIGYVVANQVALLVVTAFLSNRRDGSLTAYQQAFIFFQLPHGLFAVSLMTTVLPALSNAYQNDELEAFRGQFLRGLRLVLAVILPAAAGYAALAAPLVSVLLERGAFDAGDASTTGRALVAFALGLPGFSVYLYTLRAFYARSDTKRPFLLNVFENGVNVAVAAVVAVVTDSGAAGFAAAFSVAYTLAAALALVRLGRTIGGFGAQGPATAVATTKLATAALSMGVLVAGATRHLGALHGSGAVIRVGVGVALGVVTFAGLTAALRVEELSDVVDTARRRIRGRGQGA